MRVFFYSMLGQVFLNAFILFRGRLLLSGKTQKKLFYSIIGIEVTLYFIGYFFYSQLPDSWMIFILGLCNTWFIAALYFSFSLLIIDFIRLINKLFPFYPTWLSSRLKTIRSATFVILLLAVSFLLGYGHYMTTHPVITHVALDLAKSDNAKDSVKLVMMTDLHIGELIGETTLKRYVDLANQQEGDLIVVNGDLIDYELRFAQQANAEQLLSELRAPLGVYITLGNHEYRASVHAKKKWLRELDGITLLIDSVVSPDGSFYLLGRDDYINQERKPLVALLKGLKADQPVIVADHQPAAISEMVMNKVDLGIHGHTHGGQLWPNNWRLRLHYEFVEGLHRKGSSQFYVSSGTGSAYPPIRIGTRSEIVVMHIQY